MNFTHLFAFYEVARAGSLSGGALRLRVSQPAVSREVKELEERLGVLLFDRLPRGVALTYAGKLLFGYAERIFTLAEAARSELKEVAGLSSGHLTIGASATLGVYLVPKMIAEFTTLYPKVSIELTVTNTHEVVNGLGNGNFTLGFIEGPYNEAHLYAQYIGSDEIVLAAAPGYRQGNGRLFARELAAQMVILREPGSGTRAVVECAYQRAGLEMIPSMSVSDTEAIKRMLVAQQTMAYVSSLSIGEEIARGELRTLEVADMRIERALHLVWLKGRSLSPCSQAFFELALEHTAHAEGHSPVTLNVAHLHRRADVSHGLLAPGMPAHLPQTPQPDSP
ncbi:LysR substrate-binding domain-containing protein [Paraburkholderia sp. CNPSo 3076]|uniref:LysR substrate-binding domain-containing protein n=1 Tax=Paraburkholderia sp. CNPSo 3076 TaxID=2940936 RepID=UPI00225A0E59|nr:LysR substrate-binding domain-containing protein [Paraburkholderia sp. CNPSo 3076]MCX5545550.1 LysR substrate-binding domain-containing protein [Paraburkholderia sp. CNPSo 3076]